MKLFVSALEYSANIHLKYLLCELVKSENIELCGIFDENIISEIMQKSYGNLHLDCHESPRNAGLTKQSKKDNALYGKSICNINDVAVMGFVDVLKRVRFFLQLRTKCLAVALKCDKILLMDSSSFNIPLAKKIKKCDFKKEIMYYILPQVWAWKPWRAKEIEAYCDKLAAILPFEVGCYKKKARFVGHPLLDEIKYFKNGPSLQGKKHDLPKQSTPFSSLRGSGATEAIQNDKNGLPRFDKVKSRNDDRDNVDCHENSPHSFSRNDKNIDCHDLTKSNLAMTDKAWIADFANTKSRNDGVIGDSKCNMDSQNLITFMPGSRLSEIKCIFPIFLQVKDEIKKRDLATQFHLVIPRKFKGKNLIKIYGNLDDFHISFDTHTSLLQSKFAFICSGTATLECALIGTPFVLGYLGRWIEAFVVKQFLNIRFVGLANILYNHINNSEYFHDELLQENLTTQNLLDSYQKANPSEFLAKSITLRNYLKCGSAKTTASWLLQNISDSK